MTCLQHDDVVHKGHAGQHFTISNVMLTISQKPFATLDIRCENTMETRTRQQDMRDNKHFDGTHVDT